MTVEKIHDRFVQKYVADWVSNWVPLGPLSEALPTALKGPAVTSQIIRMTLEIR